MDGIKDALLRLVQASVKTRKLSKAMDDSGYDDNPYGDIRGDIVDAIYHMIGENRKEFTDSVTHKVIDAESPGSAEYQAQKLMEEYTRNHICPQPSQPRPITAEPEDVERSIKENGGYKFNPQIGRKVCESPEGDWSTPSFQWELSLMKKLAKVEGAPISCGNMLCIKCKETSYVHNCATCRWREVKSGGMPK